MRWAYSRVILYTQCVCVSCTNTTLNQMMATNLQCRKKTKFAILTVQAQLISQVFIGHKSTGLQSFVKVQWTSVLYRPPQGATNDGNKHIYTVLHTYIYIEFYSYWRYTYRYIWYGDRDLHNVVFISRESLYTGGLQCRQYCSTVLDCITFPYFI